MASNGTSEQTRDLVQRLTPSLRRFAWALAGSDRARGDELVRAVLDASRPTAKSDELARAELYRRVVAANRRRQANTRQGDQARRPGGTIAADVEGLPLDQREALLLVVLEGFSYADTATILGLPRSSVVARLLRARSTLAGGEKASGGVPHLRLVK